MSETERGTGTPGEPQSGTPVRGEGGWAEPGSDGGWSGPDDDAGDRAPQADGGDRRIWDSDDRRKQQ